MDSENHNHLVSVIGRLQLCAVELNRIMEAGDSAPVLGSVDEAVDRISPATPRAETVPRASARSAGASSPNTRIAAPTTPTPPSARWGKDVREGFAMSNEENHTEPELKVQISLFIPKSLKKRIAQYCIDHDTTQTVIVTEAIQDWFEKKSPAPCAARTQEI